MCVRVCADGRGEVGEPRCCKHVCVRKRGEDERGDTQSPQRMLNFRREFSLIVFLFYKLVKPVYIKANEKWGDSVFIDAAFSEIHFQQSKRSWDGG